MTLPSSIRGIVFLCYLPVSPALSLALILPVGAQCFDEEVRTKNQTSLA